METEEDKWVIVPAGELLSLEDRIELMQNELEELYAQAAEKRGW